MTWANLKGLRTLVEFLGWGREWSRGADKATKPLDELRRNFYTKCCHFDLDTSETITALKLEARRGGTHSN